ncbi:MAG: S1C family serine protease [bacterium]
MDKFTICWIVPLILAGAVFLAGAAQPPDLSKAYPFPLLEMEEVISRWLLHNNFEVARTPLKGGQVRLGAVREDQKWQITLKPRSPLASEVHAEYTRQEGQPDPAANKELWDHLRRYAQDPSAEREDFGVPAQVLSQGTSVVCIRAGRDGTGQDGAGWHGTRQDGAGQNGAGQGKSGCDGAGQDKSEQNRAGRETKPIQFSGFIIDRDGFILATAHDLEGIHEVRVILDNGRELKGSIRKIDHDRDLALISVGAKFDTFIPLARGRNILDIGEKVYSIGWPLNLRGTVHAGFINGPPRKVNTLPLWQVNMEILPGSSGSPVFDARGQIVAVVKGRYRGTDSVGFLIPLGTVREFLREGHALDQ